MMLTGFLKSYENRYLSKWYILVYDTFIIFITYWLASIIFELNISNNLKFDIILSRSVFTTIVYFICLILYRIHSILIRHFSFNDTVRLLKATITAFSVLIILSFALREFDFGSNYLPPILIEVFHFSFATFLIVISRFIIRRIFHEAINSAYREPIKVLIYGADSSGILTKTALSRDKNKKYSVVAFIDDNLEKVNKILGGIPVISFLKAINDSYIKKHQISELILATQFINPLQKKEIIERAILSKIKVRIVPSIDQWVQGDLKPLHLKDVQIQDLLERDIISIDCKNISDYVQNRVILITGAAGSIGSEIAKQLIQYKPAKLILIDQAETPLFELQFELKKVISDIYADIQVQFIIASVNDSFRMESIFSKFSPELVYHAAAYKHVPLMEENPYEALLVNVFGTKIIADLSVKYKVLKFVMVSTDKAVNPTNVMGATKRIAEIYTQSLSNGFSQFITTRFGNVLGSNGSVIPIFKKQIEKGGPVTLTHKEIIRYFMTIPEACSLVLEAGAMGEGGEIFIFDMGEPVKIYDLACKMIRLSGFEPDADIKIVEIGLRPGEKLFEELLANEENTLATHHPKILKASVRKNEIHEIDLFIKKLNEHMKQDNDTELVRIMKQFIPEFISNNSSFSDLDKKISLSDKN
jgi:FlaA1/EpsC-like NDP-sugar epimerase